MAMSAKKLQTEIDGVLKKVKEGVAVFDDISGKLYSSSLQSTKEKCEGDLKKEIKKLQRLRDQIKNWIGSNEIKDKTQLVESRKLIESKMEQFKICEKEMKTKAYSKEGLAREAKLDPREAEKEDKREWLGQILDKLGELNDSLEADAERIAGTKGKNKNKEQLEKLDNRIQKNKWHMARLEQIRRLMDNDSLDPSKIDTIKDDIDYYVQGADDDDGSISVADEFDIYEDLELDAIPVLGLGGKAEDDEAVPVEEGKEEAEKPAPSAIVPTSVISMVVTDSEGENEIKSAKAAAAVIAATAAAKKPLVTTATTAAAATAAAIGKSTLPTTVRAPITAAVTPVVKPAVKTTLVPSAILPVKSATVTAAAAAVIGSPATASSTTSSLTSTLSTAKVVSNATSAAAILQAAAPSVASGLPSKDKKPLGSLATSPLLVSSSPSSSTSSILGVAGLASTSSLSSKSSIQENDVKRVDAKESVSITPSATWAAHAATQRPPQPPSTAATTVSGQTSSSLPMMAPGLPQQATTLAGASSQIASGRSTLAAPSPSLSQQLPTRPGLLSSLPSAAGLPLRSLDTSLLSQQSPVGSAVTTPSPPPSAASLAAGSSSSLPSSSYHNVGVIGSGITGSGSTSNLPTKPITSAIGTGIANESSSSNTSPILNSLRNSMLFAPVAESDRQGYVPRNPYPTHPAFPSTPLPAFENAALFEKFTPDTLFFAFYYQQGSYQQFLAAKSLKKHSWRFHKKYLTWFQRHEEPKISTDDSEEGTYVYFDYESGWCQRIKSEFKFEYSYLEDETPSTPSPDAVGGR